ncbi:MAG: ketopantoate reductase family protein [Spirochaetales bacterium]|nr:ketopantoate reductase family protein [Candidatus Physcosoma equi]
MIVRIIGRGSVGTSVASNLLLSGDCAFVVGEERSGRVQEPVLFNGQVLPVPTVLAQEEKNVDLILVAVKNFQLMDALPVIKPLVGPDTTILPILNGIDSERVLSEAFGEEKVLYGFISGLSAARDGNIVQSPTKGKITFGEKSNERTERVEKIAAYFLENQMNHVVPQDILHEKWWKFMNNTAFNTLTATLDAVYGVTGSNSALVECAEMIMKEVLLVGRAHGVNLREEDIASVIKAVKTLGGNGKSSMLEDVSNRRETENQYFCGSISRLGREYGIATPYTDFMGKLLEARRYVVNCS